ncbi:DUF6153 family protein [Streptomyces spectabilis]|uniref:Uncharacterized protein n=1 Tax=Streptomyces spectabilis TaxID=68270 RepID=A0A516R6C8_STRST|nr:DUF6153 family protein [Streptomyces spectabilis]QDQ11201.1 hypothetical protein FH965_11900 [Streptomyces spectabilis]
MTPKRQPASASGFLLLVALLFGIVTMHTLGHPQEHGGGSAPADHARMADATARHGEGHAGAGPAADARTVSPPEPPSHDTGMDPMSVCLAVLGSALVLALFGAVAARPPLAAPVRLPAGLRAAPWPNPPPPRALLARLSVLRI